MSVVEQAKSRIPTADIAGDNAGGHGRATTGPSPIVAKYEDPISTLVVADLNVQNEAGEPDLQRKSIRERYILTSGHIEAAQVSRLEHRKHVKIQAVPPLCRPMARMRRYTVLPQRSQGCPGKVLSESKCRMCMPRKTGFVRLLS
ncbi:hypothetical protein, partial [Mesorhizobium sp. M1396]|uniref:hypothetical protein n=1 Tax=Mesorhizobium sp. M1396 TaxID=2957095 RepID=UPI00333570FA